MTPTEAGHLLAMAAGSDRRTVGDLDVEIWHDALNDLPFTDCRDAVRAHIRNSPDWLTPHHIRSGVKRIRADRITRNVELPPNADPDDVTAYLDALRTDRRAVASGTRRLDIGTLRRLLPAPPTPDYAGARTATTRHPEPAPRTSRTRPFTDTATVNERLAADGLRRCAQCTALATDGELCGTCTAAGSVVSDTP